MALVATPTGVRDAQQMAATVQGQTDNPNVVVSQPGKMTTPETTRLYNHGRTAVPVLETGESIEAGGHYDVPQGKSLPVSVQAYLAANILSSETVVPAQTAQQLKPVIHMPAPAGDQIPPVEGVSPVGSCVSTPRVGKVAVVPVVVDSVANIMKSMASGPNPNPMAGSIRDALNSTANSTIIQAGDRRPDNPAEAEGMDAYAIPPESDAMTVIQRNKKGFATETTANEVMAANMQHLTESVNKLAPTKPQIHAIPGTQHPAQVAAAPVQPTPVAASELAAVLAATPVRKKIIIATSRDSGFLNKLVESESDPNIIRCISARLDELAEGSENA